MSMHKRFLSAAVITGLILSLIPSPSVRATGGTVVISEVLTGTSVSASAEFVELRNQTTQDIDITGWKIQYLSATGTTINQRAMLDGVLKAGGFMFASTNEFGVAGDAVLGSGMPESGGRLRLVDSGNVTIDALSWGSSALQSEGAPAAAPAKGQSIIRNSAAEVLVDTDNNATDFMISSTPVANGGGVYEPVDICPNIDGNQTTIPDGHQLDGANCLQTPLPTVEYPTVRLNEILPDPGSPKADASDEFIELYNPNDTDVDVTGYRIASGSNLASTYTLPAYTIPAHSYLTLYSSETKIGLANSGSKLQLQSPDQNPMGDVLEYGAIGTDQAWAYFGDGWKLTDKPTANAVNEMFVETEAPGIGGGETVLSPCPDGKYRNPLTNRCRKIASLASTTLAACQDGYERNTETNRCRKIASETNALKPCDAGEERNVETNRCRKVAGASTKAATIETPKKSGVDVMGIVALGVVGTAAVGYGAYEWRHEISKGFTRLLAAIGKK
jgi:hypothetical protein